MQLGFTDNLRLLMGEYFGRTHSLTLISHVPLLGFPRFWEVLVQTLHCDKWTGKVVSIVDALDPRGFGWENCCRMEVSDCAIYT